MDYNVHPYMPNSVPSVKQSMLKQLNVTCLEDLYKDTIPSELRLKKPLNLPSSINSEAELTRHIKNLMNKNRSCYEMVNFLGAGCYMHQVPAVCDEIASRAEFLTAYCGDTYSDHGKMQAIFEYASMLGELVDMDVVSYTTYDGGQAACSSMRMALRLRPGKNEILIPSTMNPEILSQAKTYVESVGVLIMVKANLVSGEIDLEDLKSKMNRNTAAVFVENPSYLGFVETGILDIEQICHAYGAVLIVMPELLSLGIMEAPVNYGADIVCGEIQPLGIHMQYGGGCGGFIATRNDADYIAQYPTYLYGIAPSKREGQYGWGRALNARCSHGSREKANEYFGTASGLWAIVAGVYMALMGPQGMKELAQTVMQRTAYAIDEFNKLKGVKVLFKNVHFQEFVVQFTDTKLSVKQINTALVEYGILGGKDLSGAFKWLEKSALYCCSELTTPKDIHNLVKALKEIL